MIFDSHAHYDDKAFDPDREELLASLPENGIGCVINVTSDLDSQTRSLALAERYDHIYTSVGFHPSDIGPLNEEVFSELSENAKADRVVAIGEIGLDYYWEKDENVREQQRYWYRRQLSLAKERDLPVIIHSRDAANDTLTIMKEAAKEQIRGVIHCYSYSTEQAKEYLSMGYYLGIGGVLTVKNSRKLRETVEMAPLDRLLLETDCPYLCPEPNRGKRNSSLYLPFVVSELARIKGIREEEVEAVTEQNARELFGL